MEAASTTQGEAGAPFPQSPTRTTPARIGLSPTPSQGSDATDLTCRARLTLSETERQVLASDGPEPAKPQSACRTISPRGTRGAVRIPVSISTAIKRAATKAIGRHSNGCDLL